MSRRERGGARDHVPVSHGQAPRCDATRPDVVVGGPALRIREVRTVDNPYLPRTIEIVGVADDADDEPSELERQAARPTTTDGDRGPAAPAAGDVDRPARVGRQSARRAWVALVLLAVFSLSVVPRLLTPGVAIGIASILVAFLAVALLALAFVLRARAG